MEAVTYSTFKKLNLETTLSKLSRVLDTEHFALVVHNQRLCKSGTAAPRALLLLPYMYTMFDNGQNGEHNFFNELFPNLHSWFD